MRAFEPQNEDVIELDEQQKREYLSERMFQLARLKERVEEKLNSVILPLLQGLKCRHLSAGAGGGWKQGTLRLRIQFRFEFVPDDGPPNSQQ